MKSVFNPVHTAELIRRIDKLTPGTKPKWGKMSVSQMLAHCNVSYEMIYENKHPKPNALMKLLLKLFVKNKVVSDKPYKQNGPTAPQFLVADDKNFEEEKNRLIHYIQKTQKLGEAYFDQRESFSFGRLSIPEWINMMYKHLDHHLNQFGV